MQQYPEAIDNAKKFLSPRTPRATLTTNDYVTYAEALSGNGQDSSRRGTV